jgi:hypothetical protein
MNSVRSNSADFYQTNDSLLKLVVKREVTNRIAILAVRMNRPFYEIVRECLVRGLNLVEEEEREDWGSERESERNGSQK